MISLKFSAKVLSAMLRERLRNLFSLRGNLPAPALSEVISNTGWNMYTVLWQPYVLSLGATMPILGSLTGLETALRSGFLLITGRITDFVGRKRLQVVSHLLSITGIALAVLAGSWFLLIPTIIFLGVAGALWVPANNAMVAESVKENERGTAFSLISLTWFTPGFYAPVLAGYLAERYGFRVVLSIMLITSVSAVTTFQVFIRETLKQRRAVNFRLLLASLGEVFKPRFELSKFYVAMIIDSYAGFMIGGIFFGMLMKTFGFTLLELGILSNVLAVTVAVSQVPMGKLVDRYGGKRILIVSRVVGLLSLVSYLFAGGLASFVVCRVISGLASSTWTPAFNTYVSNAVPEEERGRVFGDLNGLMGLTSFPAPILGAFLYESYGFQVPILATLVPALTAIILLTTVKER